MQIKDLKPKQGNVDITLDVVDVGETREFQKFGKPGKVATAIGKDETGDIRLTLWNEDIDKVKAGDKVKLSSGYVNEWQGEMQLTTGRMGKLEVVGKAELTKDADSEKGKEAPQEKEGEALDVEEEDIEDPDEEKV
tara:strand:+ start:17062 stop:17469 length:408 start_codon:yes stop_codon:yes gene_type:complete